MKIREKTEKPCEDGKETHSADIFCEMLLSKTHTHTHSSPPASPVYVLKGPQHHSLPCVHPASRPNEPCVYLPPAAGKRGGVATIQSRTDGGRLSSGKHGEARCVSTVENSTGE